MDIEEMTTFSQPKLSRLVEPLSSFSPAITSYATPAVEVVKKEAGAEQEKQEVAPAPPRPRRVGGRRAGQIWRIMTLCVH